MTSGLRPSAWPAEDGVHAGCRARDQVDRSGELRVIDDFFYELRRYG
jgi:hypothetical protein